MRKDQVINTLLSNSVPTHAGNRAWTMTLKGRVKPAISLARIGDSNDVGIAALAPELKSLVGPLLIVYTSPDSDVSGAEGL